MVDQASTAPSDSQAVEDGEPMDIARARTIFKSFQKAAEAGDVDTMESLLGSESMQEAMSFHAAQAAKEGFHKHWKKQIERAGGERKPLQYTQDLHSTLLVMLKAALFKCIMLETRMDAAETVRKAANRQQAFRYRGVYKGGETYRAGEFVTFGGSMWLARTQTSTSPTEDHDAWQLAVRRGKNGRDLR